MALDRQSIERRDFPIGEPGYDRAAVDAHLSAVATEVEELRRASAGRGESLAAAATQQVWAIIEAAESSAAEIKRQAEAEAREIRSRAASDTEAAAQTAASVRERLDAMRRELEALERDLAGAPAPVTEAPAETETVPAPAPGSRKLQGDALGEAAAAPAGSPPGDDESEGARLVALNMALNGTPREETERYLAEHFQLSDRSALLDDVYAAVGS